MSLCRIVEALLTVWSESDILRDHSFSTFAKLSEKALNERTK